MELESVDALEIRMKLYHEAVGNLERIVNDFTTNVHKETVDAIFQFVNLAYDIKNTFSCAISEIPAALVFGGINSSDHHLLYKNLRLLINQNGHLSCTLSSKDCNNLKNTIKSLIEQFMKIDRELVDENATITYAEAITVHSEIKKGKLPNHDMMMLKEWYKYISAKKSQKIHLAIIIQDYESFNSVIFQNLIKIITEYKNDIRFVLIVNMATTIETFHSSLPTSVLALLQTQRFSLHTSQVVINGIVEKIFIDNLNGMKMSARTFEHILNRYQLHDLSVSQFINGYKYSLMTHFYHERLSILTEQVESNVFKNIQLLKHSDLERLRMMPSFKRHVESLDSNSEICKLLNNDEYLKSMLPVYLKNIQKYHEEFAIAFKCYVKLQAMVNNPSFKRPIRTLYFDALKGTLQNQIVVLLSIFRNKSIIDVIKFSRVCYDMISVQSSHGCDEILKDLELWLQETAEFEQSDIDPQIDQENSKLLDVIPVFKQRNTKVSQRTAVVEDGIQDKKDFSELGYIKHLMQLLKQLFQEKLKPYDSQVFHELFYFDNSRKLLTVFSPPMRLILQTGIGDPGFYLSNGKESDFEQEDISIMYQLHLECGRLINLYDWFVAFKSMRDPKNEIDAKTLQIRFMKASSELQFMGFIKPTERKTDHVERLTWA